MTRPLNSEVWDQASKPYILYPTEAFGACGEFVAQAVEALQRFSDLMVYQSDNRICRIRNGSTPQPIIWCSKVTTTLGSPRISS